MKHDILQLPQLLTSQAAILDFEVGVDEVCLTFTGGVPIKSVNWERTNSSNPPCLSSFHTNFSQKMSCSLKLCKAPHSTTDTLPICFQSSPEDFKNVFPS